MQFERLSRGGRPMNTTSMSIEVRRTRRARAVADYVELTKPKIASMVLVTVGVASFVANGGPPNIAVLVHTLLGTALVAASASALNQWLECGHDARMREPRIDLCRLAG